MKQCAGISQQGVSTHRVNRAQKFHPIAIDMGSHLFVKIALVLDDARDAEPLAGLARDFDGIMNPFVRVDASHGYFGINTTWYLHSHRVWFKLA